MPTLVPTSRIGAWLSCLIVSGCIGGPLGGTATPGNGAEPAASSGEAPAGSSTPTTPASDALLRVARDAEAGGDRGAAVAALERALRIAPTDPRLWLELGELRFAAGDVAQARAMALKALSLAGTSTAVEADARRLLDATATR